MKYISSFAFLDDDTYMLFRVLLRDWLCRHWNVVVRPIVHRRTIKKDVKLRLPALGPRITIFALYTRNGSALSPKPPPSSVAAESPFAVMNENRLLVLMFTAINDFLATEERHLRQRIKVYVRTADILATALAAIDSDGPIDWDRWGPGITRWERCRFHNAFESDTHGLRYLTTAQTPQPSLSIMDFNPRVLRRYQSDRGNAAPEDEWEETERLNSRVVTEESVIATPWLFKYPVVGSLPYRETLMPLPAESVETGGLMLDADHVIQFNVSA